jgi:hypothetical protein
LVDIDGDGQVDLISGSWPGELYLFRGGPNRSFGAGEKIKDKDGKPINVGGGVREQPGGGLLITGDAPFETTPEGTFVTYDGKRYESTAEKQISTTGCASAVHAVDWDGDGDLDLLVGEISGVVYLVPNEGSAKSPAFGKKQPLTAGGKTLRVERDAGPFAADWDGDGDLDLLVGAGDGSVSLFRNSGTARASKLGTAEPLVPPGETLAFGANASKVPVRGIRAKVCATDWDGDGRLDLLLGDFNTQATDLPPPTPEEKVKHDEIRKELEKVQSRFSELIPKIHGESRVKEKEELEKVSKEMKEVRQRMQDLSNKLPTEYENHGWVWLFLRKPVVAGVGGD